MFEINTLIETQLIDSTEGHVQSHRLLSPRITGSNRGRAARECAVTLAPLCPLTARTRAKGFPWLPGLCSASSLSLSLKLICNRAAVRRVTVIYHLWRLTIRNGRNDVSTDESRRLMEVSLGIINAFSDSTGNVSTRNVVIVN